MTITERRPKGEAPAAFVVQPPQVNLLPPEVRDARRLNGVKRVLALVVVGVLVLCAVGYLLAVLRESAMDDALVDEQNVTTQLQSDAAEFQELPRVRSELDRNRTARAYGMSPDVDWNSYLVAIATVLPTEAKIEQITENMSGPVEGAVAQADPLQPTSVGRFELVARMPVLPDTADWMDRLDALPGLDDVRVATSEMAQEDGGAQFYRVTISAQVTEAAFTGQYTDNEEG